MNQADLIDRITTVLSGLPRAGSAFLGGSFGRGEADDFSDVDVYVVVAGPEDIPPMLTELSNNLEKVHPIAFSNVLPNARTINSVTKEWLRFDFTVLTQHEIGYFARDQLKPLFDRLGVFEKMRAASEHRRNLTAEGLVEIVNEFIRVLGLSVVVNGRDDVVTAQTGTNLLRDMLIRIMAFENGAQPTRGVLSLKRGLTPSQYAALMELPPLEATWPSVFARSKALATQFLPRARALANELGAKWPEEFERVTLANLRAKLGLVIEGQAETRQNAAVQNAAVITPYEASHLGAVVELSLRAWAPVFESMRKAMGPDVFRAFYRNDWRAAQRSAVESVCGDPNIPVWVAWEEGRIAGFVALRLHPEDQMGQIYMIAVDPDFQRRGIAARLTTHSLEWFKAAGMSIAMVETGGDPGHAPARRAYEASGFWLLPVARYFQSL